MKTPTLRFLLIPALALLGIPTAPAQSSSWSGTAAGNATFTTASDWLEAGNWSPSGIPNSTTANVTFNTGTAGNIFLGNVTSTTVNVGSLTFLTNGWTIRNSSSLNSQLTLNGANGVTSTISGTGTNTVSATVNLAGNTTFTLDTGDTFALGSVLTLNGNTLTVVGGTTGALSFTRSSGSGINTASSGTIQVNSGVIRFRNVNHSMVANQTLTMNGTSSISLDGGFGFFNAGTTNFNSGNISTIREAGSGVGTLGINGAFNSTAGTGFTVGSNTTVNFNTTGGDRTLNSNLTIGNTNATLSANGSNSLILTGSYSDGSGSAISIGSGATLVLGRTAGGATLNGQISGAGNLARTATGGAGGSIILLGNNSYTGTTTLNYESNNMEIGNANGLGAGDGTVGTGTVVTSGKLYVRGGIAVANEHLTINGDGGFGTFGAIGTGGNASWNGPIVIGAASTNPILQARLGNTGNTFTLGGNITGTTGSPIVQFNQWSAGEEGNILVTGNIGNGAATALGVNINLTHNATRSVTFSGTNSYTGNTTVTSGTLILNSNNSAATGAVNVLAAGTLAGTGTVGGATTISGTLSIGTSPGTMTFADSLTLSGGSTSLFEINAFTSGNYDLALGGTGSQTVAFGGTLDVAFQTGFSTTGSVKIFDFENYSGSFSTVNFSGLDAGYSASFDSLNGMVTVVPEPSTWALLAAGLTTLTIFRRRRIRN